MTQQAAEQLAWARAPRVAITGFMAAGKTTVARALAERLGCAWLDLDEFIAARNGRAVPAIIAAEGEARFRELETAALAAALATDARVLALGGGAWTLARNRALVAQAGCVTVWLDAPFDLCWQRIEASQGARPLAPDRAQARARYDERRALYRLAAQCVPVNATQNAADIAAAILSRLQN
ncbi:MAG TPA: shikimate kinase [Pyrinomonadaceae bacterium]|jgi:shikimate kinase